MPTYTVEAVEKVKDYPGKDGKPPVPIYKLTLNNGDGHRGVAELFDNTRLNPQVGQQVEGMVETGQYGLKFKPASRGGGGGRPGRSPEERRSIERQACLKAAVEYHGRDDKPPIDVVQTADIFWQWVQQS